jgi:hypothetical protein
VWGHSYHWLNINKYFPHELESWIAQGGGYQPFC